MELETARSWTGSHIVGSPERVRKELLELADRTGADELMITTMVHSHADRLRSYEMVADVMDLLRRLRCQIIRGGAVAVERSPSPKRRESAPKRRH